MLWGSPRPTIRRDSTVRIQVGRLRQKLTEYYAVEGADDPVIVDLPKGHFKVTGEARPAGTETPVEESPPVLRPRFRFQNVPSKTVAARFSCSPVLLVLAIAWGTVATIQFWREHQDAAMLRTTWTPDLEQLWGPVLASNRP